MAENPSASKSGAVVIDANFSIALAAREAAKEAQAKAAIAYYTKNGYLLFAPGVIASETLFVLCGKERLAGP